MKDKINLDELLKQEMGNLSSPPPADAWQFISNQLPIVPAAPVAASVKTIAGIGSKVIIATTIGVVAISAAAWVVINKDNQPSKTNNTFVQQTNEITTDNNITSTQIEPITSVVEQQKPVVNNEVVVDKKPSKKPNQSNKTSKLPTTNFIGLDKTIDTKKVVELLPPIEVNKHEEIVTPSQPHNPNQPKAENAPTNLVNNVVDEAFLRPNIPNVFTPNADGYNDEFVITIESEILFDLKITDAKGNVVFESKDKNKHWNGTNQKTGENCQPGLYVLVFRYQVEGMEAPKIEQGFVLLKQ